MTLPAHPALHETEQYYVRPTSALNMSGNLPPRVPDALDVGYRAAVEAVIAERHASTFIGAHQFCGSDRDRAAGAEFLSKRLGTQPAPDSVVVSYGTQAILTMLLSALAGVGSTIAVEKLSYPTIRQLSGMLGVRCVGVDIDGDGLVPEALDAICMAQSVTFLYVQPTLHNPTTAIMPSGRRVEIANVCRRYGVTIVEDDVYSLLQTDAPPPLSSYAPELSWYILGTAKCVAAALKVAYVLAPSPDLVRTVFWPGAKTTFWMAAPMASSILSELRRGFTTECHSLGQRDTPKPRRA